MLKKLFKYETRVAIFYWLFGMIWIYTSDYLLAKLFPDPEILTRIQNYKGWFFVTASALLIYFLFRHYFSEQRQIQQSLQDSEEKFRTFFESANVGKSHTKLTGEIYVNQAYADMLGYTREELAHRTWQSLTPPEEVGIVQTHLDELLAIGSDSTR
jgi:PAS domain-containing protein